MTNHLKSSMPDNIYVGFTGDSRYPTYWLIGQSLTGETRTKYVRADLVEKMKNKGE